MSIASSVEKEFSKKVLELNFEFYLTLQDIMERPILFADLNEESVTGIMKNA